jgi:hypothetical protein
MLGPLRRNWMLEQLYRPAIVIKNPDPPILRPMSPACFLHKSASFMPEGGALVEATTVGCSMLDQLTVPPCITNANPIVERRESTSPA